MPDASAWLPSLVVFGVAAVLAVSGVVALRRAGVRRERRELAAVADAEVRAKQLIVQADDAVRDAEREVSYAEAQFGTATARDTRAAVERAKARLREAFLLQQRLDDAEPDTAADRRGWTARIDDLCRTALSELAVAGDTLAARRRRERGAGDDLPALTEDAAALRRAVDDAATTLARLSSRYDPSALGSARADAERAAAGLAEAEAALAEATTSLEQSRPAAEPLERAADALARARRDLDELAGVEPALAGAADDAGRAAAALGLDVDAARAERDGLDDPDAAADLGTAIAATATVLAERAGYARDPLLDRDRLSAARDRLDAARAAARTSQHRLDGARGALGGAMSIAEGQIAVAGAAIERGGRSVGAAARTRLAEAERQLETARQEADPVAALDAARRASTHANDAEALARYDALGPDALGR
ncbi:hypothetical protein MUN74_13125 [Agromyces endophyticus]|uniref:hypothetical protein n=1 Tax=Agromyces sp. H17E-10 TaxID=2932244 RepID=UPI001FD4028C|nr:hypothetical protein [Agromyces sp. H17E-10]UOQ88222.1 hypothetical protein MUN74_13125 [Agromyces sp. H17E-10]